jgi:hypothetical protein
VHRLGWLAPFITLDWPAPSARTKQQLGWHPEQSSLITALEKGYYFGLTGWPFEAPASQAVLLQEPEQDSLTVGKAGTACHSCSRGT